MPVSASRAVRHCRRSRAGAQLATIDCLAPLQNYEKSELMSLLFSYRSGKWLPAIVLRSQAMIEYRNRLRYVNTSFVPPGKDQKVAYLIGNFPQNTTVPVSSPIVTRKLLKIRKKRRHERLSTDRKWHADTSTKSSR